MKYLILCFSILSSICAFTQIDSLSFSFTDTSFKKNSMLVIDAIGYSNDVDKYYFDETKIDSLAMLLKKYKGLYIEITCHEDLTEMPLLSVMATTDQALEIRRYLMEQGVRGTQVEIYGYGDMNPLISENDMVYMNEEGIELAKKTNRRIEVKVLSFKIIKPKKVVPSNLSYPR